MMLPVPSDEQRIAVEHIVRGDNVILDAVAGSGKSTTVLTAVSSSPSKQFLLLAFNATLRMETKTRLDKCGLAANTEVHTFHSLCVKYYNERAHTDTEIRSVCLRKRAPRTPLPKYDVIVLDEAQDMTYLYFMWMAKFTRDAAHPFQLLILGDWRQGIYEFKGADIRCLTLADKMWEFHPHLLHAAAFHRCTLHTSYRITNQMAQFINRVMLGEQRLIACKDGDVVHYKRNHYKNLENSVIAQVNHHISAGKSPGDIFILAASIKSTHGLVRRMENALVTRGIPCYVPMFDTEIIDTKIMKGKVVFSTFHAAKGRERPITFVMGFDQSYFRFFAKTLPIDRCPNTLYVACTRATELLMVLESNQAKNDRPLTFLKMGHASMIREKECMRFQGMPQELFSVEEEKDDKDDRKKEHHNVIVTDLVKFVSEKVMESIGELMENIYVCERATTPASFIDIPTMVSTSLGFYEDVCDINGIAIPSMYFDHMFSQCTEDMEDGDGNRQPRPVFSGMDYTRMNRYEEEDEEEDIEANPDAEAFMDVEDGDYVGEREGVTTTGKKVTATDRRRLMGSYTLYGMIRQALNEGRSGEFTYLKTLTLPFPCEDASDYLYLSNIFIASKEKLLFKITQIRHPVDYTWLEESVIDACMMAMDSAIGQECAVGHFPLVEHDLVCHVDSICDHNAKIDAVLGPFFIHDPHYVPFRIFGRADLVTSQTLWEIKCTSTVSIDHKLQLVVYAWLWMTVHSDNPVARRPNVTEPRQFKLYNVRSGELWRLNATYEEMTLIVVELLRNKYSTEIAKSDEEFLQDCTQYMHDFIL
jgi:hypothetical protein